MLPNLDKLVLYTPIPALQNFASGQFDITASGTILSGHTATFTGSTSFSRENSLVRLYISQDVTPTSAAVDYSAGAFLPSPPYSQQFDNPTLFIKCSEAGDPTVTDIGTIANSVFTTSDLTTTLIIENGLAGTLTLTTTIFTIRYVAFLPTQPFSPQ